MANHEKRRMKHQDMMVEWELNGDSTMEKIGIFQQSIGRKDGG